VKAHTRKTKSGELVNVKEHEDKRPKCGISIHEHVQSLGYKKAPNNSDWYKNSPKSIQTRYYKDYDNGLRHHVHVEEGKEGGWLGDDDKKPYTHVVQSVSNAGENHTWQHHHIYGETHSAEAEGKHRKHLRQFDSMRKWVSKQTLRQAKHF
jgi:hypothetical protein